MCLFKKQNKISTSFDHKFLKGDFVDFFYKDDVYFGTISGIKLENNKVLYDIDIGGQCPETYKNINEEKVIRIHKE